MSDAINRFRGKYVFLSNTYMCEFEFNWNGEDYLAQSVEHAFQAYKCENINNFMIVLHQPTSLLAKKAGQNIPLVADWDNIKESIMYYLLKRKFNIPCLREKLLATGDAELIEGNSWGDDFWGYDLTNKVGKNILGKTLMNIRERIKNDEI